MKNIISVLRKVFKAVRLIFTFVAVVVLGITVVLFLIWTGKEIITPKDLSQIQGVWLTHDGDEQLYGKLELRIIHDSAYFGNRIFADGRPDSLCGVCAIIHLKKDSLVLRDNNGRDFQAWRLESLDEEHLVLAGDSYSYDFIKQ
ncbi:hypothetical protein [Hymenobacter cheonanensis]|uniref:hypothetical protein n=1 Tax=Hymenobacter sp. CA2-7 TaxID=3063993 RepID=UPI002712F5B7|nr:hypothetical protein [Hymenobacter sp. CA2-7]MDO7886570.1 hypothetical protein [Hymenobacter sp. CA2-7]